MDLVLLCEAFIDIIFMFVDTTNEIACDTDVESAIWFTCKDVDGGSGHGGDA